MPIRACPECGSDRLAFPKTGSTFRCNDCPWAGVPTEFPNYSAWQAARANRVTLTEKAPPAEPAPADGPRLVA